MQYTIQHIAEILKAEGIFYQRAHFINSLLTDSRRIVFPSSSLFFALHTERRDGHAFIPELYKTGVKCFVVTKGFNAKDYNLGNFIFVKDTLHALQQLSVYHRSQFNYPVIGITGSNGKTIVKEWLYQLLSNDYNIVRSPRSYNSQIGVPLSVWQMNESYNLALFEAGISKADEMNSLQEIIKPNIGLLTNIGEAHNEEFKSIEEKTKEKFKLFKSADVLICNTDDLNIQKALTYYNGSVFSWSYNKPACVQIQVVEEHETSIKISVLHNHHSFYVTIPFTDAASAQNAVSCICVMLYLKTSPHVIMQRMQQLHAVDMRMQLLPGINNCSVINDSYSFDVTSLSVALDFLMQQHQHENNTVIISDLPSSNSKESYQEIADMLHAKNIHRVISIGEWWNTHKEELNKRIAVTEYYHSTEFFLSNFSASNFKNEVILLKGARSFRFERISAVLQQKVHQTVMEINLTALAHNLKQYQRLLKPGVKLMAMVKAFGYGTGAGVANVLQFYKVDYLAVAYADEGVDLRKAGISLPILVLNVDEAAFETLVQYNLEPEIFSLSVFKAFDNFLERQELLQYPVHVKLDTGMHRLGFEKDDLYELISLLPNNNKVVIKSVFSHLAVSDKPEEDKFTEGQIQKFLEYIKILQQNIPYKFIRHIANSAAIQRNSQLQFDMVRLGIGLYGIDSSLVNQMNLQTVATLKTTIAQIRRVSANDSIGYNRSCKLTRDSLIATLRIGYADGFRRHFSNGVGKVYIRGKMAPVVGTVAMDMTMVDVTDIDGIKENDEVEIFGKNIPVSQVAKVSGTIPYEILTSVNQRVKRIYVEE